jgi:hypothetical protein
MLTPLLALIAWPNEAQDAWASSAGGVLVVFGPGYGLALAETLP